MRLQIIFLSIFFGANALAQNSMASVLKKYNKESIPYIHVNELNNTPYVFLDAREWQEYRTSHLPKAIFVGYNNFQKKQMVEKIKDKKTPIVVYCSIGVRSEQIAEKIKKMGYQTVYNLYGGIFEYKNLGNKVFNEKEKPTDSVHTYSKEWSIYLNKGVKVYEY